MDHVAPWRVDASCQVKALHQFPGAFTNLQSGFECHLQQTATKCAANPHSTDCPLPYRLAVSL
jgi:hypothetical protein